MATKQELIWWVDNYSHTASAVKSNSMRLAAAKKAAENMAIDQKKRDADAKTKASSMSRLASKPRHPKPRSKRGR